MGCLSGRPPDEGGGSWALELEAGKGVRYCNTSLESLSSDDCIQGLHIIRSLGQPAHGAVRCQCDHLLVTVQELFAGKLVQTLVADPSSNVSKEIGPNLQPL